MWLLDLFGSGSGNLKSQNLKSVPPCACFHGFFSRVLGFPVTMLDTLPSLVRQFIMLNNHLPYPWLVHIIRCLFLWFDNFLFAWSKIRENFSFFVFFLKIEDNNFLMKFPDIYLFKKNIWFYRIRAKTSQDSCGLTISRSEAIDGGTWKCSMFSGSDLAGAVRYITMNYKL